MTEFPFEWGWSGETFSGVGYEGPWRSWPRMKRKGGRCRVLVRGAMNSVLVEFEDGYRAVVSRRGLREAERTGRLF